MKKILPILTAILFLVACNDNKPTEEKRIGGVVFDDSSEVAKVTLITSTKEEIAMKRPGKGKPPTTTIPDMDSDGIEDSKDSCKTVYGSIQNNGCPIKEVIPPPTSSTEVSLFTQTPINQNPEGSCVAMAIGYAARSTEWFYKTGQKISFSPEDLYNHTKFSPDCGSGTSMQTALDFIRDSGILTYSTMPYTAGGCLLSARTNAQNTEAFTYKITGYSKIIYTDSLAIKYMISQKHPVIINIIADNSFINAKVGFVWKAYSGSGSLPHCIIICGYDDSKGAYKVMNSWGTTWGDAGYSWIDYNFFNTGGKTSYYCYVMN